MRIFIETDLEGVAGVSTFYTQTTPDGRYYEQAKKLLTAEVNAAVEGVLEMGAEDILVADAHGPGAISYEDLHPAAKLIHGRPPAPKIIETVVVGRYDVAIIIGQHAMAGTQTGNMNHTQNSRAIDYYRLNGRAIGEIAQSALYLGAYDIPLIFLSGDDAACREAEEFVPGIVTAAVKQGLARNSTVSVSMQESHRRIREGVKRAIKQHGERPVKPLVWKGPYVMEVRYFHTDEADAAGRKSGAERVDSQTVRFRSDSVTEIIYG